MRIYKKGKESHLFNDLTGQKFGNLTPIEFTTHTTAGGRSVYRWKCRCNCGSICFIRSAELTHNYRTDCRSCSKKRQARKTILPNNESTRNRVYRNYKRHAKQKRLIFQLTQSEFESILQKPCQYCGSLPKTYADGYSRNGVDRIDSTVGYTIGNVVPCCEMCNRAKLDNTVEEFVKWVDLIHAHLHKNPSA